MDPIIESSLTKLQDYLEAPSKPDRYKGFDPFDGLNSKRFASSFFNSSRIARLIWLQLNKKSPVNFRKLMNTEIGYNPQALGLFISGYAKLYSVQKKEEVRDLIRFLADQLVECHSPGYAGYCWGYNFDWQARAFFQPKFTPMIVPTAFAVEGLLDAANVLGDQKYNEIAISSAEFVKQDLNRTYEDNALAFSYSPLDKTVVYNATLLASMLLGRIYAQTKEQELKKLGQLSVDFCLRHQKSNGSWTYGTKPYHQWIDNFHSGYNLMCLKRFKSDTDGEVPDEALEKGLSFYLDTFFEPSGFPKYYQSKKFPADINNPAQLVLTLQEFGRLGTENQLVDRVLLWAIKNMQDEKGFFYYQKKNLYTIRIPYMRWSQSWMFFALASYYAASRKK